jgi:hypothetical protein
MTASTAAEKNTKRAVIALSFRFFPKAHAWPVEKPDEV